MHRTLDGGSFADVPGDVFRGGGDLRREIKRPKRPGWREERGVGGLDFRRRGSGQVGRKKTLWSGFAWRPVTKGRPCSVTDGSPCVTGMGAVSDAAGQGVGGWAPRPPTPPALPTRSALRNQRQNRRCRETEGGNAEENMTVKKVLNWWKPSLGGGRRRGPKEG